MKNIYDEIAFLPDTFESEIIEIDGLPYVLEKYQWGEICSDDEIWGTRIFDLTNKRSMDWITYREEPWWWKDYIEKYPQNWEDWSDSFDNETFDYYMNIYKTEFVRDEYNSI